MYIIERFICYPNGVKNTSFVIADQLCLELSNNIERAKKYKNKKDAQTVINKYKRTANEKFTIKKCET